MQARLAAGDPARAALASDKAPTPAGSESAQTQRFRGGLMSQDLVVGKELKLYDGTTVRIRAVSAFDAGDFAGDVEKWIRQLAAHLDGTAVMDPAPLAEAPAITWASLFRFILATSNPGLVIDEAWCRAHLHFPDLGPILKAWAAENELEPVLEGLKNRLVDVALDLFKALVSAVATTAARQAPPAPGEVS
jgi:hypothetical protein